MTTEKHAAAKTLKRVPDQIADAIVAQIREGALGVGDALPTERELCETYATSRPTVREALSQLHLRGFVSADAGKRPRVAAPSLDDVLSSAGDHIREVLGDAESGAHLEQMRQFIEAGAARVAAGRASNLEIAKMQVALQANYEAIGTGDFAQTDIAFHRSIVAVVGNPIILKLHDMFVSTMLAHRPSAGDPRAHDELVYSEHRAIYTAVLNADVVEAANLVDQHLARSYRSRLAAPQALGGPTNLVGDP